MKRLVLDFETYWASDYSLSKREWTTEAYIRDERFFAHGCGIQVEGAPPRWFTRHQLPAVFAAIPWHDVALIGHNLQFDGSILAWRYGYRPRMYIDTLGMSRAVIGQHTSKHGLDALGQLLFDAGKPEGLYATRGLINLPPDIAHKLAMYCKDDCQKTWRLFKLLAPHFPLKEYRVLDWSIRKFVESPLYLDDDLLEAYLAEVIENKERALDKAGLENRDLLMSNPKYAAALEALGVRPPTKISPKTGKISFAFAKTDPEHKALLEHENPDVQALVAARLQVKSTIEETRAAAYLAVAKRGTWPVAYSYAGAQNTHRFSGNRGGGGNPMNLRRGGRLRDSIIAPHGYVQLVFDLSQIECRLALWFGTLSSKTKGMERESLDLMGKGDYWKNVGNKEEADKCDLYSYFAGMMFGRVILPSRDRNERQIGKSAVLGLGFGMGAARYMDYSETMGAKNVDAALAESTVHLYRNTYTGVKAMWRTVEHAMKLAVDRGEKWTIGPVRVDKDPLFGAWSFTTDHGLYLKYPDLMWDAEGEGTYQDGNHRVKIFGGKFFENIIQHVARLVLVDKMMEIQERYDCVMSTYDEVVMLVPANEIDEAISFGKEIMTRPHPMFPGLPIGVEYGYHVRYGQAKS